MDPTSHTSLQPDASELILVSDPRFVCETYIFDPAAAEESLGRLFAVAETEERGGVGAELLDLTIQALQREYYREPGRGILASFESALHQANLVLHDTAEQGVRDWMGHFHVAVGILAKDNLHVSTAGNATIILARKSRITTISADLSHSPITNPLRTFAQVASGTVTPRDILFFGTSGLPQVFRPEELSRFSIDHSASAIGTRLKQLYADKGATLPLAILTLSILPQHIVHPRRDAEVFTPDTRPTRSGVTTSLAPRKPLIINRTWLMMLLVFVGRIIKTAWQKMRRQLWPRVGRWGSQSSQIIASLSKGAGQGVSSLTKKGLQTWRTPNPPALSTYASAGAPATRQAFPLRFSPQRFNPARLVSRLPSSSPRAIWRAITTGVASLPRSSKIFAGITLFLAVALVVSVVLLKQKRAEEATIVRASEILHDARNSKNAAEDALIYDNRDQASALLQDSLQKTNEVEVTGLYAPEVTQLKSELTTLGDRLQKIVRTTTETTRVIGDFAPVLAGEVPRLLSLVNDTLYSFNPKTNAVLSLGLDGSAAVATQTSEGVGFFTSAIAHPADKVIVLSTDSPGVALFDAKDSSVQNQEITLPGSDSKIASLAVYGSRLYVYDSVAKNIFGYTKTLRGYTNGAPWITNTEFPKSSIVSLGVDGNIYTLHTDGAIHKLLKGEPVAFTADTVNPPLAGASKLIKSEELASVYVFDVSHKRVVIFDETGKLVRQLFIDVAQQLTDVAISPDEKTIYALDGTRVLAISLE